MKRSGKFYRKNEEEVMKLLGFDPTPNSGSGWIVKEDGQNENAICQLKSTDAQSIKVSKYDIDRLEYNASVENKLPVFAIQFLQSNEVFLVIRPEYMQELSEYIESGKVDTFNSFLGIDENMVLDDTTVNRRKVIKSSSSAKDRFREEQNKKFEKERKSAL